MPNKTKGIKRPWQCGENHPRWVGGAKERSYRNKYNIMRRHKLGISKYYAGEIRRHKAVVMKNKEYSESWHFIRRAIYKRDEWKCQECFVKCVTKDHKDTKRKICCHHIDYNEKNNSPRNLITMCTSCHAKTNFDRLFWVEHLNNKGRNFFNMLDIMDKNGKVIAVLLDDGSLVKKEGNVDDLDTLIKAKLKELGEKKK